MLSLMFSKFLQFPTFYCSFFASNILFDSEYLLSVHICELPLIKILPLFLGIYIYLSFCLFDFCSFDFGIYIISKYIIHIYYLLKWMLGCQGWYITELKFCKTLYYLLKYRYRINNKIFENHLYNIFQIGIYPGICIKKRIRFL